MLYWLFQRMYFNLNFKKMKNGKQKKISLAIDDVDVFFFFLLLGRTRWKKKWLSSSKLQPLLRWNLYPALPFNCHAHVL